MYLKRNRSSDWPKSISYSGHEIPSHVVSSKLLDECDVIFCEWALGNAVHFSNFKPAKKRLIVRLHAQELRILQKRFLDKINWSKVDALIVISPYIKDRVEQIYPEIKGRIFFIPNYVSQRKIGARRLADSPQFNIGMLGIVPALKRVDLALQLLLELKSLDPRYKLFIKGSMPKDYEWMHKRQAQMEWYCRTFARYQAIIDEGAVQFESASEDVASWYGRIGVILSLSDSEGSHQAVAEAMASGCVPAIRSWEGARQIYGPPVYENIRGC